MKESSVPGEKHIQGNPLEFHLRMFAAALQEAGYRDRTMCSKLRLLADLGHWLKRTGQPFASHLEEDLLEAFVKHEQRMQQMHGGDSKTLQQFLAHLRKQDVVSDRQLIPDRSPLAVILGSYEQNLLLERKLSSATIFNYLSFAPRIRQTSPTTSLVATVSGAVIDARCRTRRSPIVVSLLVFVGDFG